jgi:hypothetical protein
MTKRGFVKSFGPAVLNTTSKFFLSGRKLKLGRKGLISVVSPSYPARIARLTWPCAGGQKVGSSCFTAGRLAQ